MNDSDIGNLTGTTQASPSITISDAEKIKSLEMEIEKLKNELKKPRSNSRGPKAVNKMCKEVAWTIRYGSHRHLTTREAAEMIGLTYGQIYSARNLFTFKDVDEDSMTKEQANLVIDVLVQNTLAIKGAENEARNSDSEENGPDDCHASGSEENDPYALGAE